MNGMLRVLAYMFLIDTIIMCGALNTEYGQHIGQPITTLITNRSQTPGIRSGRVSRTNLIEISPINVIENNRKKSNNSRMQNSYSLDSKTAVLGKQGALPSNLKHVFIE